jgi:hypothetical protein
VKLSAAVEATLATAMAAAASVEDDAGRVADAVRTIGHEFGVGLCERLLRSGGAAEGCGMHFFVYDSENDARGLLETLATRGRMVSQEEKSR